MIEILRFAFYFHRIHQSHYITNKKIKTTESFHLWIHRVIVSETINVIIKLPALERVQSAYNRVFDLSRLTNIKEWHLHGARGINMEVVSKSLIKLERLVINYAGSDDILPFIRHSKRLNTLRLHHLNGNGNFDLFALNEQRKWLANAGNTIFQNYEEKPKYFFTNCNPSIETINSFSNWKFQTLSVYKPINNI